MNITSVWAHVTNMLHNLQTQFLQYIGMPKEPNYPF